MCLEDSGGPRAFVSLFFSHPLPSSSSPRPQWQSPLRLLAWTSLQACCLTSSQFILFPRRGGRGQGVGTYVSIYWVVYEEEDKKPQRAREREREAERGEERRKNM